MIYYLNILLPLIVIILIYIISKFLNPKQFQIVLIGLFLLSASLTFPLEFTDLRANIWIYEYFIKPIFISCIAIGILIIVNRKYFKLASILIAIVAVLINISINFIFSYASAWGGGNFNEEFKNEPILIQNNLEIVEHQQSSEFSHYMLNRTYLNGLLYRQVGFETRDNSICQMTFKLRDTKEIYEFDKCNSTLRKVE